MLKKNVFLLAVLWLTACSEGGELRPNIILISIDTLRWDYLASYGYPDADISPAVDWLAENGLVFDQAVASAGTTIPSHGTMLTGLYPRLHGARSNFHALYPQTRTIAQALTESGYQTGVFTGTDFITEVGELNRGFQVDNLPFEDEQRQSWPHSGEKTVRRVAQWLDTLGTGQPIFLFLHLWEPHGPYVMSERAQAKLDDYDGFLKDGVELEHLRNRSDEISTSPEHVAALQAIYSGEVHLADHYLGRFLADWEARGLLDNTVIIFTADHGQSLGERGKLGHGPTHREHVIRVPMIISDFRQGRSRQIQPGRTQTRVGTIDISPTISALADIEETFDWFGQPLLSSESLNPDTPYFVEVALRTSRDKIQLNNSWYDPNALGVWSGDFKLILRQDRYTMFRTWPDNRFPSPVELESEPIISDYLAGLIDSFHEVEIDSASGNLLEDELRELQGLGYTQ